MAQTLWRLTSFQAMTNAFIAIIQKHDIQSAIHRPSWHLSNTFLCSRKPVYQQPWNPESHPFTLLVGYTCSSVHNLLEYTDSRVHRSKGTPLLGYKQWWLTGRPYMAGQRGEKRETKCIELCVWPTFNRTRAVSSGGRLDWSHFPLLIFLMHIYGAMTSFDVRFSGTATCEWCWAQV